MRLICFDPGGTTGAAEILVHPGTGHIVVPKMAELQAFEGLETFLSPDDGHGLTPAICISEFLSANHPSFQQIGIRVMGAIEYLCYLWDITILLQPPSKMEPARRLHPLKEVKSLHIRDAIHHGIAYAYKECNMRFEVFIEPAGGTHAKKVKKD